MLLEFISSLSNSTRIEHPEDLIFDSRYTGSASDGARSALSALQFAVEDPSAVTVKYDGYPALIFGRNADGNLVVADKHMFKKRDGTGRVTSLEQFIKYDSDRGYNRGDLYEKLNTLWPGLEHATRNVTGYYWGDLLWTGTPSMRNGAFVFKPNTVTYAVDSESELGKRIESSIGGIVVHQFFEDFDSLPVALNGNLGQLLLDGPIVIINPTIPSGIEIREPVQAYKTASAVITKYAGMLDNLLDPMTIAPLKCKDLPNLMKRYINDRLRGKTLPFVEWVAEVTTDNKKNILLGEDGYLLKNMDNIQAAFIIHEALTNLKMAILSQLDGHHTDIRSSINGKPAGEGFVVATPGGLIKMVNRTVFSAANFAKNL